MTTCVTLPGPGRRREDLERYPGANAEAELSNAPKLGPTSLTWRKMLQHVTSTSSWASAAAKTCARC
jgi:hypothetical protein